MTLAALAWLGSLTGCGGTATELAPIQLRADGRLERGDSVQVVVTREGTVLGATEVQVAVVPAAAGHLLPSGWLRFDAAGPLDLVATATESGAVTAHLVVTAPPLIVYDYLESGNRDIYVAAIDGGDLRRLTSNVGDDQHPTASAGKVVFTSYRDGNAELYSLPLAGGPEQRLTTTTANETEPALSTTAQRLAYISSASGAPRLWLAAGDGTGAAAVATGATGPAIEAQPTWSRSGDQLAFTSTNSGNADLYLLDTRSGAVTIVGGANTPQPEVEPSWLADGSALIFVSSRAAGSGMYRIRLAEGAASLLLAANAGQPTVLADGRIVYTTFQGNTTRLSWIDPAAPSVVHEIPTGSGSAAHPSAVR
jgi:Tol biopolymer transport system component